MVNRKCTALNAVRNLVAILSYMGTASNCSMPGTFIYMWQVTLGSLQVSVKVNLNCSAT